MKIGIITDSFRLGLRESLKKAADLGADGVQIYAVSGEMAPEALDAQARPGPEVLHRRPGPGGLRPVRGHGRPRLHPRRGQPQEGRALPAHHGPGAGPGQLGRHDPHRRRPRGPRPPALRRHAGGLPRHGRIRRQGRLPLRHRDRPGKGRDPARVPGQPRLQEHVRQPRPGKPGHGRRATTPSPRSRPWPPTSSTPMPRTAG